MIIRRTIAALVCGVLLSGLSANAAETVRVGEINSYSRIPSFTESYRKGWQLAVEQVNARGGVQIEVISRDDNGEPSTAIALANELLIREDVDLLAGTFLSNIGLAVSELARQRKVFFLAAEPLSTQLTWEKGNRHTWRLRPSTWMQNKALAEEAAKLPAQRWALIAPNYEYGQSAVAEFKRLLLELKPDVEFVAEQWPAQGRLDAGPTVQALLQAEPDAIYNATFATDLVRFVREGQLRGLFDGRDVVSLITGEPEYLDPLGAEAPEGWIVSGYPWSQIDLPEHTAFLRAFQQRWDEPPKLGAVVGYAMIETIAAAVEKAGSTNTEALLDAMAGLEVSSPFGPIVWRGIDHQATLGTFIGRLGTVDGQRTMVDWRYADGAIYQPTDDEVRRLRPPETD